MIEQIEQLKQQARALALLNNTRAGNPAVGLLMVGVMDACDRAINILNKPKIIIPKFPKPKNEELR
jgi:hypothetical protein